MSNGSGNTIWVSTHTELLAGLQTASTGDVIELANGDYGALDLSVPYGDPWAAFAGDVTIRGAQGADAVFSGVSLRGVTNLHFENVTFTAPDLGPDATLAVADRAALVALREVSGVSLTDVTFVGDTLDAPGDARDGLPGGFGLTVRNSDDIAVGDSLFTNLARAATFDASNEIVFDGNEVTQIRSDGVNFSEVSDVQITNSHLHDFTARTSATDHRDMIQFWTRGTEAPSEDIVIRGNILDSGAGEATQSIFMRNELVDSYGAGEEFYYQNVTIEQNVIHNGHLHGITVGAADGLSIVNNILLRNAQSGESSGLVTPVINLDARSLAVTVQDNIASAINGVNGDWAVSGNLLIDHDNPSSDTYVGGVIINPFSGAAGELADWQLRPDVDAVGASLSQFAADSSSAKARIMQVEDSVHQDLFHFDAGHSTGAGGDEVHHYLWDFGDGHVATGREVSHRFEEPGRAQVTLTVIDGSGLTDQTGTWIDAATDLRLDLAPGLGGVVDMATGTVHDIATDLLAGDPVIRLSDAQGYGLDRGETPEIFGLSAFDFDLSLTALDGAQSGGEVFRIHQSMRLKVEDDSSLRFEFTNDAGELSVLTTDQTAIFDGSSHDLRLSYDVQIGQLSATLNGDVIGSVAASGKTKSLESWGLTLGAAFGKAGFDGAIETMRLTSDPLDQTNLPPAGSLKLFDFDGAPASESFELKGDAGVTNGALEFDAQGDAALLEEDAFLFADTNQVSYGMDVQMDGMGASGRARLLWKHLDHGIQITGTKAEVYVVDANGVTHWLNTPNQTLLDGEVHRLGLIIDGDADQLAFYVDGVKIIDVSHLDLDINHSTHDLSIGAAAWTGHGLDGRIDNFVVSDLAYGSGADGMDQTDLAFWTAVGLPPAEAMFV